MIGRILDAVAGRVTAADAVVKTDELLTVAVSADGDTRVASGRSRCSHLRVVQDGRIGVASSSGDDPKALAGWALTSAASGEELPLLLPAAAPLPEVVTRAPQAAVADTATLAQLARGLVERLARSDRRVEAWAERSTGLVQVGNTRSVLAGYELTLAGVGAVVESIGAGWAPPLRVHTASVALPGLLEVETLVAEVDRRLDPPIVPLPAGFLELPAVCFAPRAFATFLRPLKAALCGREALLGSSPLRGRVQDDVVDRSLTLSDDSLAAGRPGSRPIDDDGVPSRRVMLIAAGRLVAMLSDIATGARAGVPSTGHGWRSMGAAARVGFTNLRVSPGSLPRAELLAAVGTGLLIEELEWGTGPNCVSGALRLRAPWAYLVEGGSVRGRLEGIVLSGNAFESLRQEILLGNDTTWLGAQCLPSVVVGGLTVSCER